MSKLEFSIVSPFNGELIIIQIECDVKHQEQIENLFKKEKQRIEYEKRQEKHAIEEQERLTKKVKKWECDLCGKVWKTGFSVKIVSVMFGLIWRISK